MISNRSFFRWALSAFLLLSFLYLFHAAGYLPFDFDELAMVHSIWNVTQGLLPYTHFYEGHTPFFWYLYAPVLSHLPEQFQTFVTLRQINIVFSIAALLMLALVIRRELPGRDGGVATLAGLALVFLQPTVTWVLSDFRIDHLSCALVFLGVWIGTAPPEWFSAVLKGFLIGAIFTVAMAFDAKLFLIPPATAVIVAVTEFRAAKPLLRYSGGMAAGIAAAAGLGLLILKIRGIDIDLLYQLVYQYQGRITGAFGWGRNLAWELYQQAIKQYAVLTIIWLASLGTLLRAAATRKIQNYRGICILAVHAFFQPFLVQSPFKQYMFSLYLALAGAMALFFYKAAQTRFRKGIVVLGVLLISVSGYFEFGRWEQMRNVNAAARQMDIGNRLLTLSNPGDRVAMILPYHAVFRRDSTYGWSDAAVANGPKMEDLLMTFPRLAQHFSTDGYLKELAENPPAVILIYEKSTVERFREALTVFATSRPNEYQLQGTAPFTLYLRKAKQ